MRQGRQVKERQQTEAEGGNVLSGTLQRIRIYFALVVRNLARHKRRSALGVAAVSAGITALILAGGFVDWMLWAMREDMIRSQFGHIQIVRSGFPERGASDPFAYLLPERPAQLEAILRHKHVQAVAPRLLFDGLIGHGDTTVSFVGQGVSIAEEKVVSRKVFIESGQDLSLQMPDGIIIGAGLAESLGAEPGSRVTLLATSASGGINAVEVYVRGVFRTARQAFDDSVVRMPIGIARSLLRVSGAHQWVALIDETERTEAVLDDLRARLASMEIDVELLPWYEMADFYNKTVRLFNRQVNVVEVIIGVLIVLSITNILVMSVLERTREIGTLMALGIKSRSILQIFVGEALLLGVVGGIVGLGVGYLLSVAISAVGIPMPPAPGMAIGWVGEIRVTWPLAGGALLLAACATLSGSVYPAWKASRLEIVDALRHSQ